MSTATSTTSTTSTAARARLAVAQTTPREIPDDDAGMRAAGDEVLALMARARAAGADVLQLPEGTLCWPSKTLLSGVDGEVAEADWSRFAWDAQQREIDRVRAAARELGLWTVLGAPHRTGAGRPRLSLHVIDALGDVVARYDERLLSRTKAAFMYAAGEDEVTFEVKGVRFGCASGLEVLFEDVFADYEAAGADVVLVSTAGPGQPDPTGSLTASACVQARHTGLTIGYAVHADKAPHEPAGVVAPDGSWTARCTTSPEPDLVVVDVPAREPSAAHAWRRSMVAAHRERRTERS